MNASANSIHTSLEAVARYRDLRSGNAALSAANTAIKRFQAKRFQATYPDLLQSPRYQPAARFFLQELYSDKDYAERDQQFARIASTIAKLFPQSVVDTAAALAQLHALTEQIDNAMAHAYLALPLSSPVQSDAARYIACWRQVAGPEERRQQLAMVLTLGKSLDSLTRKPGLRMLLKMMRGPATAAGLGMLQRFLESGFDAFQTMHGANDFLNQIAQRESEWIDFLFLDEAVACETKLLKLLADSSIT